MLSWIIKITIISIIFIFLIHHLIIFFRDTLTVPKIKDLVNTPTKKYEDIFNTISNNEITSNEIYNNKIFENNNLGYSEKDLLPKHDIDSMKNELKDFLKKQLNNNNNNNNNNTNKSNFNDFSSLDMNVHHNNYSEYIN